MKSLSNIKTERAYTPIRRYGWTFTLLVAIGGLWIPKLGLLVFGVILSLTALSLTRGRYWCGNYCAHGSLFDHLLLPFSRNTRIPRYLKSKVVQGTVFVLFMLNLTTKFIRASSLWGSLEFWDRLGFVFVGSYLMVTVVGGTLGLLITPRTWCQFCPMGMMQTLTYRAGESLKLTANDQKVTISNPDKCVNCAKCARVCPMQLSPYTEWSDKNQLDNEACIRCSVCVASCPLELLSLSPEGQNKALTPTPQDSKSTPAASN